LAEFQDNEDFDNQHNYISGHNRIYYHTDTCIPIMPKELDYDSEGEFEFSSKKNCEYIIMYFSGEPDPEWLQKTTKQMIDEFTDVNDGEKELMKLWNLHCMKNL
jgi:polycomb protein SUZ12